MKNIKLYYSRNSYSFIASSEDDSKGSVSESAGSYKFHTNLTINATLAGGYAFEDSIIKRIHNLSNVNINNTDFELPNDCIVD